MIGWREDGTLLSVRRHGESSAIVELFTEGHGRYLGVIRGGASRKLAPILQPGAQLDATWSARLEDHIGSFSVEPVKSRSGAVMADRLALAGLNAMTALLSFTLPEREPHAPLYRRSLALFDLLGHNEAWPVVYLRWELALLEEMGFGLDLGSCAVTGARDDLAYVSPKSGRAVSAEGAGDWAERLLPLPPIMLGQGTGPTAEILDGLRTTGHFLTHWLAPALGDRPLPVARQRLIDALSRSPSA
jgi:DNA repair protein RecO (recombination protein O)